MSYITLDFLNKNMYRKYPFRSTSTHLFTNSTELPQSLISSIQLTTIFSYRKIYINKIYAKDSFISILIREVDTNIVLGTFSGQITEGHQLLVLEPVVTEISGSITIGNPEAVALLNGAYYLSPTNGRLEDSTIFCFTPPAVRKITNNSDVATGFIKLAGTNLTFTENSYQILLSVINTTIILSKNDFSGQVSNCRTPLIKRINTVEPNNAGNIDVYTIDPIRLNLTNPNSLIFSTPGFTLLDACPEKKKLSPPINNSNTYYTNISTTNIPEWKGWSQFSI